MRGDSSMRPDMIVSWDSHLKHGNVWRIDIELPMLDAPDDAPNHLDICVDVVATTKNLAVIKSWLSANDMEALYRRANCVLGQLGDLPRNDWTIAHKAFEAGYFGKPLISSQSSALEEVFTEGKDILFYSPSQSLSELITDLVEMDNLSNLLGTDIKLTYNRKISQQMIGQSFIKVIKPLF